MKRISISIFTIILLTSSSCFSTIYPTTTTRPLIFLPERLTAMTAKYSANHSSWAYLLSKADQYKTSDPESLYEEALGEIAAAEALAYIMTSDTDYLDQAIAMLWARYFDSGSTVFWDYTDRNGFRTGCRWAVFVYDWLYNSLNSTQKSEAQAAFVTWGNYWINYIDYPNFGSSFDPTDSDEATSLTENMLLLAVALYNDNALAADLFDLSDGMLSDIIVDSYMVDKMAGGVWSEGGDYGPQTMKHFVETYLINKEARNISYPNSYVDKAIESIVYITFPGKTSTFFFGDFEQVTSNYRALTDDSRFSFMEIAADATESSEHSQVALDWLNGLTPPTTATYGPERFIFEKLSPTTQSPSSSGWALSRLSDGSSGYQLAALRSGWNSGSALYFIDNIKEVDHQHQAAGDFAIVRDGVVLTKEITGYGGASFTSQAHNTLLLENTDNGNSSPTSRPYGKATTKMQSGSGWGYVSGNMTQAYNMSGYYEELPWDHIRRDMIFDYTSGIVFWSDVIVNATDSDCTWTGSGDAFSQDCSPRDKTSIFHFLNQPTESNGVYTSTVGTEKITFENIYPVSTITLVDESVLYSGATEAQVPTSQKNYHITVEPTDQTRTTEQFINVVQTMDSDDSPVATTGISVTGAKGVVAGSIAAIFSDSADQISSVSYVANATTHYIANAPVNTLINVTKNGSAVTGSPFDSGDAGLITFTTDSGSATYAIGQAHVVRSGIVRLGGSLSNIISD